MINISKNGFIHFELPIISNKKIEHIGLISSMHQLGNHGKSSKEN